jgi:hypothetical protein
MADTLTGGRAVRARPVVTSFRGDFAQLARMMQDSWAANREVSLRYTESLLRSSFAYPGASFEAAPVFYSGDQIIAFAAGLPRSAILDGRPLRLQLNTMLTVSLEFRKAGYGVVLWRSLMERARAAGLDGAIDFCVEGDDMNKMLLSASRLFALDTQEVYCVGFLNRFVRPTEDETPADGGADVIDAFLELAAAIPGSTPLARTWTRAEAEWQCRDRDGAIAVLLADDRARGVLTGYVAEVGMDGARAAIVEDVLWGNLAPESRRELVQRFIRAAACHGCNSAACPTLGYAPLDPFVESGFRRGKRTMHAYLTLWNGSRPAPLPSMYFDVF